MDQLQSNNPMKKYQHGFQSDKSYLTQLIEYLEELECMLDEGRRRISARRPLKWSPRASYAEIGDTCRYRQCVEVDTKPLGR